MAEKNSKTNSVILKSDYLSATETTCAAGENLVGPKSDGNSRGLSLKKPCELIFYFS